MGLSPELQTAALQSALGVQGLGVDRMKALADVLRAQPTAVAPKRRTIQGRDEAGQPVTLLIDDVTGDVVRAFSGVGKTPATVQYELPTGATQTAIFDPATNTYKSLSVGLTPAERATAVITATEEAKVPFVPTKDISADVNNRIDRLLVEEFLPFAREKLGEDIYRKTRAAFLADPLVSGFNPTTVFSALGRADKMEQVKAKREYLTAIKQSPDKDPSVVIAEVSARRLKKLPAGFEGPEEQIEPLPTPTPVTPVATPVPPEALQTLPPGGSPPLGRTFTGIGEIFITILPDGRVMGWDKASQKWLPVEGSR